MTALPVSAAPVTVAQVITLYLEHVQLRRQLRTLAPKTAERAKHYLTDFSRAYGAIGLTDCRSTDLTRWLLDRPQWKSASTKSDAITAVMTAFRWAVRERLIPYVPFIRPRGASVQPRPRPAISEQEYRLFMHAARNAPGQRRRPSSFALRAAVFFLWRTGARTCEMRSLRWSEIRDGVAVMLHHKTDGHGEDRRFGLDDCVLRLLGRLQRRIKWDPRPCECELFTEKGAEHRVDEHVFLSGRKSAWTKDTFAKLFRTYADRAGISKKKSAYSLRHGFCVAAIQSGTCTDREIAVAMGHTNTDLIHWYGREAGLDSEHLRSVVRRVHAKKAKPTGELPLFSH